MIWILAQGTLMERNRQWKHKGLGTWSTRAESLTASVVMTLLLGQTGQKWNCALPPRPLTAAHTGRSRSSRCWLCSCSCGPDMIMAFFARAVCNPPFWLPSLDIVLQSQPCHFAGHLDRQDPKNAICLADSSTLIFSRPFFSCHCLPWQPSDHYGQAGAEKCGG